MIGKTVLVAGIITALYALQLLLGNTILQQLAPVVHAVGINTVLIGKDINSECLPGKFKPFQIYTDKNSPDNHYIPSGWMGDYGDMKVDDSCTDNPHRGTTCMQWKYIPRGSQGCNWAGCFWQNPSNNWGKRKGGYNLTGARKLSFWARGAKGNEKLAEIGVGGITGNYSDSDKISDGPIELTKEWEKYEIDLKGADLCYISGGFFWAASSDDVSDEGITFYLDNIYFEF